MKSFKTSLLAGFTLLIATSSITPLSANATAPGKVLEIQQQTQQRRPIERQSNGCIRYSDGSIDCRR